MCSIGQAIFQPNIIKFGDHLTDLLQKFGGAVFLVHSVERLEVRRIKADHMLCYKIVFGLYRTSIKLEIISHHCNTRGHQFRIKLSQVKTNSQKHCF